MPVTSASWKASLPMTLVATWPLKTMIGMESSCAVASGVMVLVAPGPLVTMQTPGLPVDAGVAVGAVAAALLVAVEDELGGGLIKLIEDRQDRAAGISEHHFHLVLLRSASRGRSAPRSCPCIWAWDRWRLWLPAGWFGW